MLELIRKLKSFLDSPEKALARTNEEKIIN
jgi:hypothetical protein